MPTPLELFSSAAFKVGDIVHSIPDTALGVDPAHSATITGAIIELKVDGGWFYNISSIHHFHPLYLTLPFTRPRCLNTVWPGKELRK